MIAHISHQARTALCHHQLGAILGMMVWGESDEAEKAIGLCRSLGAQMTKKGEFLALGLYGSLPNTWTELFHLQNNSWVVESFFHVLRSGPPFAEHARGGADDARRLLRRVADAGWKAGAIVDLAGPMEAFDAAGLRVLRAGR